MKIKLLKTFVLLSTVSLILFSCKKDKEPDVSGCTDPNAVNYNPNATKDDGSCVYDSLGCMDSTAVNYNPNATKDDGSCVSQSTIQSLIDNTIAERIFAEVFPIVNQVAKTEKSVNSAASGTSNILCTAIIPADTTQPYPRILEISYTQGCICDDGFERKGKLWAIFNNSWHLSGTSVKITVDSCQTGGGGCGYDIKYDPPTGSWMWLEGAITITKNIDTTGMESFTLQVDNGKCTWFMPNPADNWTIELVNATRILKQTSGAATDDITDDFYEFEGTASGINRSGQSFTSNIAQGECLKKTNTYKYIVAGKMEVTTPTDTMTIDFGTGTLDDSASVEMGGGNTLNITLN